MRDQHRRLAIEFASDHDLLLIAAGKARGWRLRTWRADVVFAHRLPRFAQRRARRQKRPAREGRAAAVAQHQVLRDRQRAHQRRRSAIGRHIGEPRAHARLDRGQSDVASLQSDRAGAGSAQARERLREFDLAVSVDAGDAEDLAAAHLERQRAEALPLQALDDEPRGGALPRRSSGMRRRRVAPDHHFRQLRPGHVADLGAARDAASAQDDNPVADVEHFRQFMTDEDDALAFPAQTTKDAQKVGDLARRQIGCRLVQDQQFRFPKDRFQNFDALAAPERQVRDHGVGIEIEAEATTGFAHPRSDFASLQQAPRLGPAEHDILDHAHRFDQHEMLMDHRDARRHRLGGAMAPQRVAAKQDLARVWRDHAEQDFHQSALARAVLAEQAEDLARAHFEIDAVIGPHGAEAADDSSHFQQRGHQGSLDRGAAPAARVPPARKGPRRRFASMATGQPPLRASCSVGVIFSAPLLNCAAMSSSSFTTASGTTGLNALPSAYCSEAPVTGAVS